MKMTFFKQGMKCLCDLPPSALFGTPDSELKQIPAYFQIAVSFGDSDTHCIKKHMLGLTLIPSPPITFR